jgi:diguanylate cyclase (GGDEF)-like protein/PAS domain S-box-containing protein
MNSKVARVKPDPLADSECATEIARLRQRTRRLAEEKSGLQLVIRLVEQLNPLSGFQDMLSKMLQSIVETIGGTNIKLYYWIESELHYTDYLGTTCMLAAVDDELVRQVAETGQFIEQATDPELSLLREGTVQGAWIWGFPLMVGPNLIGVVKLENVHISGAGLRQYLPIFFSHAALILSNEIRSITRQRIEEILKQKSEELDNYFNNAIDLFCIADTDGYFVKLNPAWEKSLGYAIADLEKRRFFDLIHPDDIEATADAVSQLSAQTPVLDFVNRYRHRDGTYRWLRWRAQPSGNRILAAASDITELKRAEDEVRLAASVFANSQEGIMITDAQNRVLDVNAAFSRITGYARDEIIGQNPSVLNSGRQDATFYNEVWRTLNEKGAWQGEVWNRRKSGEIYAEMLSIDVVRDREGHVAHYVGAFTDISQLKKHQADLERIAHYDTLTGVPNRRLLADRMHQELGRARRGGHQLAVCYLDLDGFKPVNDQLGHKAGDQVLIEIAKRLQQALRAGDTLARIGGDEFILLFCDLVQEQQVYLALERVLHEITRPIQIGKESVSVSGSIGVTLFPRDDSDADTLLRHADQAMYQAKEAGKGRFHLFDAEHDRVVKANQATLQRLQTALNRREFVLFYQPKVHLVEGKVFGAEALIRWKHPVRGMLSPAEFLPVLMGTELEIALGEWVIEEALQQIEIWKAQGLALSVSVNVGANHLLRPNFLQRLEDSLKRHPSIGPGSLELEVLESAAIDDLGTASAVLARCMALGVHFALDDFGTGYSSLAYFRKLPKGTLKIDQSFVRDMLDDPEDIGIVESVIALAKAFDRPVIAEGVETIEHGAMLVLLGCRLGQGYGIARPMPAADLPAWVEQWHGEDIWAAIGNNDLPRENFVLLIARASLRKWVDRTVAYMANPGSAERPIVDIRLCNFGRWLYGEGTSSYGHLPEFLDIDLAHRRMHEISAELLDLIHESQLDAAEKHMEELMRAQEIALASIDQLIARVTSPAAVSG